MKRIADSLMLLALISLIACLAACNESGKDRSSQASGRSTEQQTGQPQAQAVGQSAAQGRESSTAFGIGLPAPDFALGDIHGRQVTLSEHIGKAVVVDFWATWCAPCRITMPHLQALAERYPDQLAILAISLDQEPQRVVPPFADRFGLTFTLLADPGAARVAHEWGGVSSIPTAYLIDPQGLIVEKWVGVKSLQEYERRIRRVLGLDT